MYTLEHLQEAIDDVMAYVAGLMVVVNWIGQLQGTASGAMPTVDYRVDYKGSTTIGKPMPILSAPPEVSAAIRSALSGLPPDPHLDSLIEAVEQAPVFVPLP